MSETWFGIPRKSIEWFPTIDYEKCSNCLACLNKCTHEVYSEVEGKPTVINKNNCVVGCTGCQKVCPNKAIIHPPKEYLQKLAENKDFKVGCNCGGK